MSRIESMSALLAALPPHARALNAKAIASAQEKTRRDAQEFDRLLAIRQAPKNERDLQNQLEALLRQRGIVAIRQRMDRRSNVAIGIPDILFAIPGTGAIAWEAKLPGENPRPEQEAMHARLRSNGWRVDIVRTCAEALALLAAYTHPNL